MPSVTRIAVTMLSVACLYLAEGTAHAASVIWTIDSSATSLTVGGTGQAPVSGLTLPTRIILQGTTPLNSATPKIPIALGGTLVSDTDFTSSIKFLKTGTGVGLNTGSFVPLPDGTNAAAPAHFGDTFQVLFGVSWVNAADSALRNIEYDFSGPSSIAISGGSFSTSTLSVSTTSGDLDYRGYGVGAGLGSGTTPVNRKIPGDANFDRVVDGGDYTIWADNYLATGQQFYQGDFSGEGLVDGGDYTLWADNYLATAGPFQSALNSAADATIAEAGGTYTLTMPINTTIFFPIDDGAGTETTTDDIFVYLAVEGTLVATTPVPAESASAIPEPSTFVLCAIGGLALAVVGAWRRLAAA